MNSSAISREGFVLPAVIFTMAILGLLAVTALTTANDEHRSSRAIRESGAALYAAEAGAHLILGTVVESPRTVLDTVAGGMASGDSVDLGWSTLPYGADYHPVFHRLDGGGKGMYLLKMVGRGAGPWGGERLISLVLKPVPVPGGVIPVEGVFTMAGTATIGDAGGVTVDGNDNVPPGWGPVCDDPGPAISAISTPDANQVQLNNGPTITGDPPVLETPFDAAAFDSLFAALVAQATIVFAPGVTVTSMGPVENPPGVCDTSVPTNWGAPEDPSHPCFDYYPIIYAPGGVNITSADAGQGILVCCTGSVHVNFNGGSRFYGLIMSEQWIELENGASLYGAALSKGNDNEIHGGSSARYSSCVMERVSFSLGLGSGGGAVLQLIGSRAWSEF